MNPLNPPRPDLPQQTMEESLIALHRALQGAEQNGKDMVLEDVIKLMERVQATPDGSAGAIRQIQTALEDIVLKHSPPVAKP